ncbi:MAG: DUF1778 domain-containing protein [Alphaproteobacteria bacterium]|nr:DUF1778 domain-containing protein [Alphaproteobacteria bacterium]
MTRPKLPKEQSRSSMLTIRVDEEQKRLIEDAAEREGLQISSFILMLLVRVHILPESCLGKIKRRPVPFFNELHALIGTVNLVGGNCKQLALALPDTAGLRSTHASIMRAAEAVTDALQGKSIQVGVNLCKLDGELTHIGYAFNDIVRSVNMGKPQLSNLPAVLSAIARTADAITAAMTGRPAQNADMAYVKDLANLAREDVRANMKNAAKGHTKRQKGDA